MKIFKKIFYCLSAFLFLNSFSGFALSIYNAHFSIAPLYQFRNGCLNEFVYANDDSDDLYKLSELNWQMKNLSYVGFQSAFGYKDLGVEVNFLYGVPKSSGTMQDSDWQNSSDHDMKTTYSISENTENMSVIFNTKVSYGFNILNLFQIKPFVGFEYNYYDFSARNGYGWYGNAVYPIVAWDDEDAVKYESGSLAGIDYTRSTFDSELGVKIDYRFLTNFDINLALSTSPYTFVQSLDTHFADYDCTEVGTCYLDRMSGIFKHYTAVLDFNYTLKKNFVFGIKGDYNYLVQMQGLTPLTGITGTSSSKTDSTFRRNPETASTPRCSGYWWDVGAYAKVQF